MISNVYPASTAILFFRVGTGAGPTYQSGASDYSWSAKSSSDASDSQIDLGLAQEATGADAGVGSAITLVLSQPANSTIQTQIDWNGLVYGSLNRIERNYGVGQYNSDTAVTAVRFLYSTGNITAGTISMYGVSTS